MMHHANIEMFSRSCKCVIRWIHHKLCFGWTEDGISSHRRTIIPVVVECFFPVTLFDGFHYLVSDIFWSLISCLHKDAIEKKERSLCFEWSDEVNEMDRTAKCLAFAEFIECLRWIRRAVSDYLTWHLLDALQSEYWLISGRASTCLGASVVVVSQGFFCYLMKTRIDAVHCGIFPKWANCNKCKSCGYNKSTH